MCTYAIAAFRMSIKILKKYLGAELCFRDVNLILYLLCNIRRIAIFVAFIICKFLYICRLRQVHSW